MTRRAPIAALVVGVLALASPARAFDLRLFDDSPPLKLDVTLNSVLSWHGDNRDDRDDDNYGDMAHRLNFQGAWTDWIAGVRLDLTTFVQPPGTGIERQLNYQDDYRVGKFYLGYIAPPTDNGFSYEVTIGDTYTTFGKGLVLSLSKQDELGTDTSLRGGKVQLSLPSDIGKLTFLGGAANPMMTDAATGGTLLPYDDQMLYGTDWLTGARGEFVLLDVTLAAHGVMMMRDYTSSIGNDSHYARSYAREQLAGGSIKVPISDVATVYFEGAYQQRDQPTEHSLDTEPGTALYSTINAGFGPVAAMAELQHYRSYLGLYPSVDSKAAAFSQLRYTAVPNTEDVTTDTRFGFFDEDVTGGRLKLRTKLSDDFFLLTNYGFWSTLSENHGERNVVHDGLLGGEFQFDNRRSHALLTAGVRDDTYYDSGDQYYREYWLKQKLEKALELELESMPGGWSVSLDARQRRIFHEGYNLDQPYVQWDALFSLRFAPGWDGTLGRGTSWNGSFGIEHSELEDQLYLNGRLGWRYSSGSSIAAFVGQQRGGFRCVGGVCRTIPDFSGAKLEWMHRF